jgi:hypothetical protein
MLESEYAISALRKNSGVAKSSQAIRLMMHQRALGMMVTARLRPQSPPGQQQTSMTSEVPEKRSKEYAQQEGSK